MYKNKILSIYRKIRLNPDPDIFTLMVVICVMSLSFSLYNTYQLRNNVPVSLTPQGTKILPIKDLIKNIKSTVPKMGNSDAKVVMVAFEDFQCPYCKRFHDETFNKIKKEYIDTGKVLFVHADLAFLGPESVSASLAGACASEQGKFWEYRDVLYEKQVPDHNIGNFSDDKLKQIAKDLMLDTNSFNECYDGKKYANEVSSAREFAESYGINSTPTFVINGQMIKGARQFIEFSSIIDNI